MNKLTRIIASLTILSTLWSFSSCESFLNVEPPSDKIITKLVFADDASAVSAISGMYLTLYSSNSFAGGAENSITTLAGLSADELHYVNTDPILQDFERNTLKADNSKIFLVWESLYKVIYQANAILEGLEKSTGVTQSTRNQLVGEALLVRAFCNFYLINCFGDVPLVLTTDYHVNRLLGRTSTETIYEQIEADLLEAESLLSVDYPSANRVRPNRYAATAMLARMYLYREDWGRAEDKASNVITQTTLYYLPGNISLVFLNISPEAIWQLKPVDNAYYTHEGTTFNPNLTTTQFILNDRIIDSFESNDKRYTNWVAAVTAGTGINYFSYKYKLYAVTGIESNEYSMVIRLAELLLIRAEARVRNNKIPQAIADLDVVKGRAGVALTNPAIEADDLLLEIDKERRLELFAEWGHRWFDLKRRGRTDEVLGIVKDDWTINDELYPLPEQEMRSNPKLRPQNAGY